jgi:hypothetical protein
MKSLFSFVFLFIGLLFCGAHNVCRGSRRRRQGRELRAANHHRGSPETTGFRAHWSLDRIESECYGSNHNEDRTDERACGTRLMRSGLRGSTGVLRNSGGWCSGGRNGCHICCRRLRNGFCGYSWRLDDRKPAGPFNCRNQVGPRRLGSGWRLRRSEGQRAAGVVNSPAVRFIGTVSVLPASPEPHRNVDRFRPLGRSRHDDGDRRRARPGYSGILRERSRIGSG